MSSHYCKLNRANNPHYILMYKIEFSRFVTLVTKENPFVSDAIKNQRWNDNNNIVFFKKNGVKNKE